jgi:ubiquinone/menaquinone biosynthesis C-methylase UbiE
MKDPHRFINTLDVDAHKAIIDRLESRAKDKVFSDLLDNYLLELNPSMSDNILEIGCGTGVVLRRLLALFSEVLSVKGFDQCPSLIQSGLNQAAKEGVASKIDLSIGDAHKIESEDCAFDIVIAHTVISHVTDPAKVLKEIGRVLSKSGTAIIFDGDYASLSYAFPDHEFGSKVDEALVNHTFNNPKVMRDLPRLLENCNLTLHKAWANTVSEVGKASYFKSFADTYIGNVEKSGDLPSSALEIWRNEQEKASRSNTFFASCNYYTYFLKRAKI